MISHSRFNRPSLAIAFAILFLVHCALSISMPSNVNYRTKPPTDTSYVLLVDKKTKEPSPAPSKVSQSSKAPSYSPSIQSTKVLKAKSSKQNKSIKSKGSKGKGSSQYYSTKAPKRAGKGSTKSPSQATLSQSMSSNMSASMPDSSADAVTVASRFSLLLFCLVPCYLLM